MHSLSICSTLTMSSLACKYLKTIIYKHSSRTRSMHYKMFVFLQTSFVQFVDIASPSSVVPGHISGPWPPLCWGFEAIGFLRCHDVSPMGSPHPGGPGSLSPAPPPNSVRHGWRDTWFQARFTLQVLSETSY